MSPTAESLLVSLEQLPPPEHHQVMLEFLRRIRSITTSIQTNLFKCSSQDILLTIQGSWGNQATDEIYKQVAQQRKLNRRA